MGIVHLRTRLTGLERLRVDVQTTTRLGEKRIASRLRRFLRDVQRGTVARAPVRTGFMRDHVEIRMKSNLEGETGWWRDTFLAHSSVTRGKFYPPWPEYGQEHHPGTPSLRPAHEEHEARFVEDVKSLMRQHVRKIRPRR